MRTGHIVHMDTSRTVTYRPNVVSTPERTTKLRWPHNFGSYRLADSDMASGSLLGSPQIQMKIKATGAIEKIFCVDAGESLLKTFAPRHWDETTGAKLEEISGHYFMFPEHQEHKFMLSNGVYIREDVFVHESIVHYVIEFHNDSEETQHIGTFAFCEMARNVDDELVVQYDERLRALVAHSKDDAKLTRIVGATREPRGYEVSIDHAMAVTGTFPAPLAKNTKAPRGLAMGVLQYSTKLEPQEHASLEFRLSVSADGVAHAKNIYKSAPKADAALKATQDEYHNLLGRSIAMTPNAEINRGVLWAKANMQRVMLKTPLGWGFTNDPTDSNNSVGRDAAWFCAGADYFRPNFAEECLMQFISRQEKNGKIIEFYNMLDGKTEDFGLNINDDTPLIVWSAWHHYQLTGDKAFLDKCYDKLVNAGRYIASQRNDDGLVWCTSQETGSKGIAGWRNVIEGYRLSGAVTEINSESYAAFRSLAALARARGDSKTADEFASLAHDLRHAINRHLINPANGLYYLNIDVDGTPRSDITCDLVLPVIFGVADRDTSVRILRRLSDRDFWTPGGMRTIPYDAINYDPEGASGCLGGVWNGVTFWFAKAAAQIIPDFSQEALMNGFENYARNPQRNNTVPGQFSEWLHGETLVNQGMELSPWFPPRYVWAVIEGTLGFDISGERARVEPNLPSDWTWCGLRNAPYQGEYLTWFAACVPEMRVWSTMTIDTTAPLSVLEEHLEDRVQVSGDDAIAVGVREGSRICAMAGNTVDRSVTTALRIRDVAEGEYSAREYDSLRKTWQTRSLSADDLHRGITIELSPKGFYLVELDRA